MGFRGAHIPQFVSPVITTVIPPTVLTTSVWIPTYGSPYINGIIYASTGANVTVTPSVNFSEDQVKFGSAALYQLSGSGLTLISSTVTANANGTAICVPTYGAKYVNFTVTGDATNTATLETCPGDGPAFIPLSGGSVPVIVGGTGGGNVASGQMTAVILGTAIGLNTRSQSLSYSGAGVDLVRGNNAVPALTGSFASAVYAGNQTGVAFQNVNWTAVRLGLNLTVASGASNLQVMLQGKDLISGTWYNLGALPTGVNALQLFNYDFGRSITAVSPGPGGITQVYQCYLPRTLRITVTTADGNNNTYSISIEGLV